MIRLIRVLNGVSSGSELELDQHAIVCGRDNASDFTIADSNVSRRHCRFVPVNEGSQYLVEDLHSSNGTYVNNKLIRSKLLAAGDRIRVGNTLLEFTTKDDLDGIPIVDDVASAKPGISKDNSSLTQEDADLDFVYQVSLISSGNLSIVGLCSHASQLIRDWAGTGQALLMLLHDNEREIAETFCSFAPKEETSTAGTAKPPEVRYNRELVERVIESWKPTSSNFQGTSKALPADMTQSSDEFEAMCVPINNGQKLLGLIYVDNLSGVSDRTGTVFLPEGLRMLATIGKQLAAAIENISRIQAAPISDRKSTTDQLVSAISHRINNLFQMTSGSEFLIDAALEANDLKRVSEGWSTVRQSQNRISQLSTNLSAHCHDFEPLLHTINLHDAIERAANEAGDSFGDVRVKITHQIKFDFALKLDSYYFGRAITNILTVGLMASEHGEDEQNEVTLETSLLDEQVLIRVGFRHFDDRFDLAELFDPVEEIDKVKAGMGMLEILVSRKIVEGHAGTIEGVSEGENLNWIEVRFPLG